MAFVFTLIGLHLAQSLGETQTNSSLICRGLRCPRGHSLSCSNNETARCVPCRKGTFSTSPSHRRVCRPCALCHDNEFELRPCTRTSDVICKKCSLCRPGFRVMRPCERGRDTICGEKCHSPVGFGDDFSIRCKKEYFTEGSGLEPGKSVEPSLTANKVSPEVSRSVERKTPWSGDGDRSKIIRHIKRHAEQNGTKSSMISVDSSHPKPSEGKIPEHGETPYVRPDIRGVPKGRTTTPILSTAAGTVVDAGDIVANRSPKDQRSTFGSKTLIFSIVGGAATVVLVVALLLVRRAFKRKHTPQGSRDWDDFSLPGCCIGCQSRIIPRPPRCPGSSDCCDGNSVSSVPDACAAENDGNHENVDAPNSNETTIMSYLSTMPVAAEVHRPSLFEVFEGEIGQEGASSNPQFVTYTENIFTSNGGKLSHEDSNVVIKIENGTISEETSQRIYFGVVNDDTILLRDIPETCENTLISPVIQCGPDDMSLSKPVEIVLPHCLYVDEVKKASIRVYRCGQFSESGPMKWEKVPSASERNSQSKAWFTVKKDTIHIKTKTFSLWSVFACGGPKRKRATVFAHKPNVNSDLIVLHFYIYSDNEDSKKRVERIEKERFPQSKPATTEKPFKMYNDSKDITVWLDPKALTENGWEFDQTPAEQTYKYEMAYKNGYRSYESCAFSVKPTPGRLPSVNDFSCCLHFQQEEYLEHFLYVNPGFTPLAHQTMDRFSVKSSNDMNNVTEGKTSSEVQSAASSPESHVIEIPEDLHERGDELVTQEQFLSICCYVGPEWKIVLRHLGMDEVVIKNLEEDNKYEKVKEKCYQGLLEWGERIGPQEATMRSLCDALKKAGCSKALEKLSKRDVGHRLAPIPGSTSGLGTSTCV